MLIEMISTTKMITAVCQAGSGGRGGRGVSGQRTPSSTGLSLLTKATGKRKSHNPTFRLSTSTNLGVCAGADETNHREQGKDGG